ncbi:MAG: hypothetical protein JXR37_01875, partial [Kiritimatiellae bacterium]|nr:hypothetical protein [Kiritimatiellia bacterium]
QLKNPWGLYRGEICLALANMEFECRLRPEDAEYWYKKAIEWMDKVGLVDSRISVFNVPGQAIGISAPPMRMKEQKAWFGPPDWSKVKPGTIINRRTCHWYLNKLRLDAHGKLALIKFLGGDAKGAQDEIGAILKYDEYERAQHDKKLPNSYRRLHYEFGRGSLRAKPEEFAAFQGRAKCLIAIADYYYEIEDWGRAEAACNRMALLHRAGKLALSNSAQAYLAYSRGMLRYVQFDFDRAAKIFRGFDSAFRRTSSWDRAKFAHRQILMQTEGCEAAVRVLKQIVRERPGTESERLAWYLIGEQYYCFDRLDASEKAFRFYLKKYPDRPEAAQSYLESIEKQRKDARQS